MKVSRLSVNNYQMSQTPLLRWLLSMLDVQVRTRLGSWICQCQCKVMVRSILDQWRVWQSLYEVSVRMWQGQSEINVRSVDKVKVRCTYRGPGKTAWIGRVWPIAWACFLSLLQALTKLVLYGKRKSIDLILWELYDNLRALPNLTMFGLGTSGPKIRLMSKHDPVPEGHAVQDCETSTRAGGPSIISTSLD